MTRPWLTAISLAFLLAGAAFGELPKSFVAGLKNPVAAAIGSDGRIYVTVIGEPDRDGDGKVVVLKDGEAVDFAIGLDDPTGIVSVPEGFVVADKQRLWRVNRTGKLEVLVAADAFSPRANQLSDVIVDPENGTLYVSDYGDERGNGAGVYRAAPQSRKATRVYERSPAAAVVGSKADRTGRPMGMALDGASHLVVAELVPGAVVRTNLTNFSQREVLAEGVGIASLAWDRHGRLFFANAAQGKIFGIPGPGEKPELVATGFKIPTDICFQPSTGKLLVTDSSAGTVTAIPSAIPGWEVDDSPLPIATEVAFGKLRWTGWKPLDSAGRPVPLRPIVLTHAGDGSQRVFTAIQQGTIHVFANDDAAHSAPADTKVFLDITDRVRYSDQENEEGLLGLTFHPKHKSNGEFFVFYTDQRAKLTNVVSRFRVSKSDPNRADPASEEVLLKFSRPYWNHDGGTICFGPDGYLYVTHGDGGAANDPLENGQNLKTLLGKVLRIDVDRKDIGKNEDGKNYAIPADNPYVGRKDAAPEIWAHGLRNIWRMAFDRQTGDLWAGEVGQNLYEEINLITRKGNYGWNLREALHPFGAKGVGPRDDLIDPIWEYHHDIGKSITGGAVYRGKKLPALAGHYLYGDYITAKIWALKYDAVKKRVIANRPIADRSLPILSFGEDEAGEMYLLTHSQAGQGIYRFTAAGRDEIKRQK